MIIVVWKIQVEDGSSMVDQNLAVVTDMINDMDEGSTYKITKILMDKDKYESLPEFQGF